MARVGIALVALAAILGMTAAASDCLVGKTACADAAAMTWMNGDVYCCTAGAMVVENSVCTCNGPVVDTVMPDDAYPFHSNSFDGYDPCNGPIPYQKGMDVHCEAFLTQLETSTMTITDIVDNNVQWNITVWNRDSGFNAADCHVWGSYNGGTPFTDAIGPDSAQNFAFVTELESDTLSISIKDENIFAASFCYMNVVATIA